MKNRKSLINKKLNISSITNRIALTFVIVAFFIHQGVAAKLATNDGNIKTFIEKIKDLPDVEIVNVLNGNALFSDVLELRVKQPIDHKNPNGATFTQRVFLSHTDFDKPMVMITEGYTAEYHYNSELASILKSNQLIVEHRYFGKSCPDSMVWRYMNVEQAAADHHKIISIFKQLYSGKWLTSGISKGGQTAIYHRRFYPNDVDVSVPYVAPLVFMKEDTRAYTFLQNVGTEECRTKIKDYQRLMLSKSSELIPLFKEKAKREALTFNTLGWEAAYEYSVFEYEFAFWQWGRSCNRIPTENDKPQMWIDELFSAADFFSDAEIMRNQAFFYQALTELGFYGYSIEPFKDLVKVVKAPNFNFYAPPNEPLPYNPFTMQDVHYWLQDYGNNILYIYGEIDAWSACAVELTGRTNAVKMVKKGGAHTTRIKSFEGEELAKIYSTLEKWLDVKIKR